MRIFCCLLLLSYFPDQAHAQEESKLRVGIFERAPFAMKDDTGGWNGLAVEAWERIAAKLSLPFEYIETPVTQAIADTAAGKLDLMVGEVAISPDRAKLVKFSQPYITFPVAVALPRSTRFPHWIDFLTDIMRHGVASMLGVLLAAMLVFSLMLWFVERSVDRSHFGGGPLHGFGSALWFAAVTMTTVGYGDKTPQSVAGRVVVFFWMFFGVVVISVFTGTVASSIALARVDSSINSISTLGRYHNGVQEESITQSVLNEMGIPTTVFLTARDGLRALGEKQITAFVGGEGSLRYTVHHEFAGQIVVEPIPNTHINYAFAMRPDLPDCDAINVALIEETAQSSWRREIERFVGPMTH